MTLAERYGLAADKLYASRGRLPLLIVPGALVALFFSTPFGLPDGWVYLAICFGCSLCGFAVRARAIGIAAYRAAHGGQEPGAFRYPFPSEGIYSRIRYPLYAGNFLIWTGVVLYVGVGWFVAATLLLYVCCYLVVMAREERAMLEKYGEAYREWCEATPAVIPTMHGRGCMRPAGVKPLAAVRRDFRSFAGIVFTFLLLGAVKFRMIHLSWELPLYWLAALGAALALLLLSLAFRRRK